MVLLGMHYAKGPDGTRGFTVARHRPPPGELPPALLVKPSPKPECAEDLPLPGLPPPRSRASSRPASEAPGAAPGRQAAPADGRSWACMASQPVAAQLSASEDDLAFIGGLPPPGAQHRASPVVLGGCPPGLSAQPSAASGGASSPSPPAPPSPPPASSPVGRGVPPHMSTADARSALSFDDDLRTRTSNFQTMLGGRQAPDRQAEAYADEYSGGGGDYGAEYGTDYGARNGEYRGDYGGGEYGGGAGGGSSRLGMWFSADSEVGHTELQRHAPPAPASAPPLPDAPGPAADEGLRESSSQSRLAAWCSAAQTSLPAHQRPEARVEAAAAPASLSRPGMDAMAWLQQYAQAQAHAQAQQQRAQEQAEHTSRQQAQQQAQAQAQLQAQHAQRAIALLQQQQAQQSSQQQAHQQLAQYQQQVAQYQQQQAAAAQHQQQLAEYHRRLQQQQRQPNPPLPPPSPQPSQQAVAAQLAQLQQQSHQLLAALQQQRHQLTPQQQKQFEVQLQAWRQQQQRLALLQQQAALAAAVGTPHPPPTPAPSSAQNGHAQSLLNPQQRQASHQQLSAMLMPHLSVLNGAHAQQQHLAPAPSTSGLQQQMFQVQHLGLQQQLAMLQAQLQGQQQHSLPPPPPPPPPPLAPSVGSMSGHAPRHYGQPGAPAASNGFPPPPSHYPTNGGMMHLPGGVDFGGMAGLSLHPQQGGGNPQDGAVLEQQTMRLKSLLGLGGGF